MRLPRILDLALRASLSQPVAALLIMVVAAFLCGGVLATVGRSAAIEHRLFNDMESPSARMLIVRDISRVGFINSETVTSIKGLTVVDNVLGVGHPRDVRNGLLAGVEAIPIWEVSQADVAGRLLSGRYPRAGEAMLTPKALSAQRLSGPTGYLESAQGKQYPVVGVFQPSPAFDRFAAGGVVTAENSTYAEAHVLVRSIRQAHKASQLVLSILGDPPTESVGIDMPTGLDLYAQTVADEVSAHNRTTLFSALIGGTVLIGAVVFVDVLLGRNDIGRRRALGISRTDLTIFTTLRTFIPATIGAMAAAVGVAGYFRWTQTAIPWKISIAIIILTLATAAISSLLPALWAARRDPVAVLRTP
ncbi:ABC transporter permease [Trueperella pyogenes]|uniref:ABC transporter permease n=1 Tax=Trueperella pyogenes TaxID=1661 RepID=UPI00345DD624